MGEPREALLVDDDSGRRARGADGGRSDPDPGAVRTAKWLVGVLSALGLLAVVPRLIELSTLKVNSDDKCVEYSQMPHWLYVARFVPQFPVILGIVAANGVARSLRHCAFFARHTLLIASLLVTEVLLPATEGRWYGFVVLSFGFAVYDSLWERLGMWGTPLRTASSLAAGFSVLVTYTGILLDGSRCNADRSYFDHLATAASTQIVLWMFRSLRAAAIVPRGNVMLDHDRHVSYKAVTNLD